MRSSTGQFLEKLAEPCLSSPITTKVTKTGEYQENITAEYIESLQNIMDEYRPSKIPEKLNMSNIDDDFCIIDKSTTNNMNQSVFNERTSEERNIDDKTYSGKKRSAYAWKEDFFEVTEKVIAAAQKSFHEVDKVIRKGKGILAFFKHNPINSPTSELEVTASQFYRLHAPDLIPKMHTVCNKIGEIIGVISKAIKGFKSCKEDPLKATDLIIESLDNKTVTIPELKEIFTQYQQQTAYKLSDKKDDELLLFTLKNKTISLKASDLKHFEIIRGNAISLTLSYFFEEDDLHCGNISKKGERIDFDMSLWMIFHKFKNIGFFVDMPNRGMRNPNETQFDINEEDILTFPILTNAKPFYWPIKSEVNLREATTQTLNSYLSLSSNAYKPEHSKVYALFATNPVFKYYQYQTLLELSLTPQEVYQGIADLEINSQVVIPGQSTPAITALTEHIKTRTQQCREALCNIREFRTFMQQYGETALNEMIEKHTKRNNIIDDQLNKYGGRDTSFTKTYPEFTKQKMDLEKIRSSFNELHKTCLAIIDEDGQCKARLQKGNSSFMKKLF